MAVSTAYMFIDINKMGRSEVIYAWYCNRISSLPEQIVIIHFQISITTPATSLISRGIKQLAKKEIVVG